MTAARTEQPAHAAAAAAAAKLDPVLSVRNLELEFPAYGGAVRALDRVTFRVDPGEIVGLVGESGSGKSVAAMAALGLWPARQVRITGGRIALVGRDLLALSPRARADLRGGQASMVFQEPMAALNPSLRIGVQIGQLLHRHQGLGKTQAAARALQSLMEMHVPDPQRVLDGHAFELSGGMRQRVLLAMAFACNPQLLIADEPTTALDVTVQAQVLDLLRDRARAHGTAVLFISHDLAVVSQLCSRLYVMYAGQIIERGAAADVLAHPWHPYTRALLRSLPDAAPPGTLLQAIAGTVPSLVDPPMGCRFKDRCELAQARCAEAPLLPDEQAAPERAAACWFADAVAVAPVATARPRRPAPGAARGTVGATGAPAAPLLQLEAVHLSYPVGNDWRGRPARVVQALNGVDLCVRRGETVAIVGESGCGKTTLAQLVMGLRTPTAGRVIFDGADLARLAPAALRRLRRRFQLVFQDPQGSLDPRMPAWALITEPLEVAIGMSAAARRRRAAELADLVGIRADQLSRFAHQFSGGQRQRLAIARALALEPELLVLDEPTSALDVSIQAQILNLLIELQSRLELTYLFISHNVAVVRHVADRVAVMYRGEIVEIGPCATTIDHPQHPYTRQLIAAVPRLRLATGQEADSVASTAAPSHPQEDTP
jgi:oligopeptide/dipeptide ABC transporter ATP-binding protein